MKKLYLALAALAALVATASCDRTDPYYWDASFVTFNCETTQTVREDAGTFTLPIRVMGEHPAFSVTLSTTDGTAKNNTHYKIVEPASGVLNFSETDVEKTITLGLIKVDGYVEPGRVDFSVKMESSTMGVELGSRRSVTVTITDADHPLADLIGAWTVVGYDATNNSGGMEQKTYTMNLFAYEGDVTRLWCDGINGMSKDATIVGYLTGNGLTFPDVYCVVSEDHKQISFPTGQQGADMGSSNGGVLELVSGYTQNGYYLKNISEIVFYRQEDGTYRCDDGILWLNDYVWPTYGGFFLGAENEVFTTWTKQ